MESHNKFSQNEIDELINLISKAKKPVIYTGGGVINSGPKQVNH
jgi:acetolactate synthase-1/2/3 large subunit